MSDNNLNKNTLIEASLGSKDKNIVEGMQVDKITKSEINNIVQNIYSNPTGLEILLTNIITRLEKLEKKNITNNNDKKK